MKCFWGASHHRWKLKFLGAWLLPCQYPWLLPWISAWSLMPWVLPCHKTSGSMAFAMQPSMVFITTSTTPHLYKACWGWKSESYINSISVDLLRVDWKKKKRISRLPTAERRGWALVHSSFVGPYLQTVHLYGWAEHCVLHRCLFKVLVPLNNLLGTSVIRQGFSPVWVSKWASRLTAPLNEILQFVQQYNFINSRCAKVQHIWAEWFMCPPTILWWCKKNFKVYRLYLWIC